MSENTHTPREKLSKIPSWIMVGVIIGGLAAYTFSDYLPHSQKTPPAAPAQSTLATPPAPVVPPDTSTNASPLLHDGKHMSLYAIDTVFRQWIVNAMWDYNTTEVVFWNPVDGQYSVAIEVTRHGDEANYEYFYRPIEQLTRPIAKNSTRADTPILFTENEEATTRRKQKENEQWFR